MGCPSPSATPIELWATSSGTPTPRPLSWRGWRTRPWTTLLSGTTLAPSTAARGVGRWISSLRDSPARRSRVPASAGGPTTPAGSGPSSAAWFATLRHDSCSSKTCLDCWSQPQASLLGSDTFYGTWPPSGSMRSGSVYQRPTAPPRISASGSSSWPTATAADSQGHGYQMDRGTRVLTLSGLARLWPTPAAQEDQRSPEAHLAMKAGMAGGPRSAVTSLTVMTKLWHTPSAAEGYSGPGEHTTRGGSSNLRTEVAHWPTPSAHDDRASGPSQLERNSLTLVEAAQAFPSGHQDPTTTTDGVASSPQTQVLNPRFVEMLMGWPDGWSACAPLATGSFRSWRRRHSSALLVVLGWSDAAAVASCE